MADLVLRPHSPSPQPLGSCALPAARTRVRATGQPTRCEASRQSRRNGGSAASNAARGAACGAAPEGVPRRLVTGASASAAEPVLEETTDADLDELLGRLKWDKSTGLLVAIAQNVDTGAIMMQGFADRRAVGHTLRTKRATFFSRSRKTLWTKGETSNNFIQVLDVFVDCDGDSLIYWGLPDGPTCHTGETTCFFAKMDPQETAPVPATAPLSSLFAVEQTILERQQEMLQKEQGGAGDDSKTQKPSWTQKLLSNPSLLCSKIREEADELCRTLEEVEGKERAASEMADLLYHSLVLLRTQGVMLEDVAAVLRGRFGMSGVEEKASRKPKAPAQ